MRFGFASSWGACVLDGGTGVRFRLWAPAATNVSVVVASDGDRNVAMQRGHDGWFECVDPRSTDGTCYWYEIDGRKRVPDPAARFMPNGPDAPSEVVDPRQFAWPDDGTQCVRPLREHVIYELHVGTFTAEGTYAAAEARLNELVDLGITAIELMPLAQSAGLRNWGYDGVGLYAPSHTYGRPDQLKAFIARAHACGLSVFLDVVYSHFGPEGNYLHDYAPAFFDHARQTPWGQAPDYTKPAVRAFLIENACYWVSEYRFDGLRLDAVDAIADDVRESLIAEMSQRTRAAAERPIALIIEGAGGEGALVSGDSPLCNAQWNDEVHHCLHVALTGESDRYYGDYRDAPIARLGRALVSDLPYVNYLQNHDQIGNRAQGDRISALASPEATLAATAVVLLAPSVPLLFMGQEWAASSPFLYFCDFAAGLAQRVRSARRRELGRSVRPADPGAVKTFARSTLNWDEREQQQHLRWLEFHRRLLRIRREEIVPLMETIAGSDAAYETCGARGLRVWWNAPDGTLALDANLGDSTCPGFDEAPPGRLIFAWPTATFVDGVALPWSVRWTLR